MELAIADGIVGGDVVVAARTDLGHELTTQQRNRHVQGIVNIK